MDRIIDLSEAGNILDVSAASVRNWVRTGIVSPVSKEGESGRGRWFSEKEIRALKADLEGGRLDKLKKRRNKKYVEGRMYYRGYIDHSPENEQLMRRLCAVLGQRMLTETQIRQILAGFAAALYRQAEAEKNKQAGKEAGADDLCFQKLLGGLAPDFTEECRKDPELISGAVDFSAISASVRFVPYEDFLGFAYLSLKSLSGRKTAGAYYTPVSVAQRLVDDICSCGALFRERESLQKDVHTQEDSGPVPDSCCGLGPVLDPCCGSGNILLTLMRRGIDVSGLYGTDIDDISICLARINLFLNNVRDPGFLYTHLLLCDFIREEPELPEALHFCRLIVGNPPWRNFTSPQDKKWLAEHYACVSSNRAEAFDVFTEKALSMTCDGGMTAFVLPEAVLTVGSHEKLRAWIRSCASPAFADYIGDPFAGIQCPSILLGIRKGPDHSLRGCRIHTGKRTYRINKDRPRDSMQAQQLWCLNANDREYDIICRMEKAGHVCFLKDKADFALGIVTGINKNAVYGTISVPGKQGIQTVPVLRGRDLRKFSYEKPGQYLFYDPEQLQQVAPEKFYRAREKLIYRFVGKVPVFSYDGAQMFTLNSANILIPHLPGLDMKYVLAVLNSRTVSFWWQKKYNALKMLRSHLESIPIPIPKPKVQETVTGLTERLIRCTSEGEAESAERRELYGKLESIIMDLYELEEGEKKIILAATPKDEGFL